MTRILRASMKDACPRPARPTHDEHDRRPKSMADGLKLMTVLAHPDDESLATGGSLAKYGSEGVET